jgi:hypothetical protein
MDTSSFEARRRHVIKAALDEIRDLDLREQARRGGFDCEDCADGGCRLILTSFGSRIEMEMPSGEISLPPGMDSLSMRVLALRYVKLSCGVPESGEWIAYRDLPGGRFYAATLVPTIEQPLAMLFGGKPGMLGEISRGLGGIAAPFGDEAYVFRPFPRTPLLLVLHWGDEEFAPGSRMLFDRCCSHYLNTDDLKVLATQLAAFLIKRAGAEVEIDNLLWMVE